MPAALRLWPRALAVAVLASAGAAHAQYRGGQGDGYSTVSAGSYIRLDGVTGVSPAYFSSVSGGDGYSVAGLGNSVLNGSTLPAALYTSSTAGGDGYDSEGLVFQTLNGAALPAAVFTSSPAGGDGYDAEGVASQTLDGSAAFVASYTGGGTGGDGYDKSGLLGIPLDVNLAFQFIFTGGNGDGYDTDGLIFTALDGAVTDPAPYTATVTGGDGYDVSGLVFSQLNGTVLPVEIYTSSVAGGDGYDASGTSFVNLNGAQAFLVSYMGATGDGYDDEGLRNFLFDAALALPSVVFTGGNGDGYDTETVPYILFMGAGGAAAPLTYTLWRDLNFTDAEVTSGLAADNADADGDGLANLVEYTTGGDPRIADAGIFGPQFRLSDLSDFGRSPLPDKHLTAIVRRDPRIFDATLSVEFATDTSLWNAADAIPVNEVSSLFIVRDRIGVQEAPRRLMRLRATVNP